MKTIDFSLVFDSKLTEKLSEDAKKQGATFDPKKVCLSLFIQGMNDLYKQGASLEVNRKYAHIMDAFDGENQGLSLEDADFDFLFETYKTAKYAPNTVVTQLVDYCDGVKNTK